MVDRTEEDVLQDKQIADLWTAVQFIRAEVLNLKADVARLMPLASLAARVAEIEAFFERAGMRAFPERKS